MLVKIASKSGVVLKGAESRTGRRVEGWCKVSARWMKPFWWMEYEMEWCAYLLSNWSFLEVLEYLSSFGVQVAVLFYFAESGDRLKQKHYQAWR